MTTHKPFFPFLQRRVSAGFTLIELMVVLGPEPVIGPQQIRLVSTSDPSRSLILATDGIRPFSVMTDSAR